MRVIAIEAGFYDGSRRRVGAEFEFDVEAHGNVPFKKGSDGNPVLVFNEETKRREPVRDTDAKRVLPKWVVPATPESRRKLGDAAKVAAEKELDAVKAAAGPKRTGREAVREGPEELV